MWNVPAKLPGIGVGNHPNTLKQCRLNGYNPNSLKRLENSRHKMAENIQKRRLPMYEEIIDWLTANVTEPVLVENEYNSDIVNIWFTVLNTNSVKAIEEPESDAANHIMCKFIKVISTYLPREIVTTDFYSVDGRINNCPAATPIVKKFCEWYTVARGRLENYLAKEYFVKGRMKDVEILKRRYKQTWSESKVVDLTADQTVKVDSDNKIELRITDA